MPTLDNIARRAAAMLEKFNSCHSPGSGEFCATGGGGGLLKKDPAEMSAPEINRALDRLDPMASKITREFIDTGRGHERPSDYKDKTDPLSMKAKAVADAKQKLYHEMARRYGPNAPHRLPTRGYGPLNR